MSFRGLRGFDPGGVRGTASEEPGPRPPSSTSFAISQQTSRPEQKAPQGGIVFRRPLVPIITAIALIEVDHERQILELIDGGKLRWAFDVAGGDRRKREVRILGESINEYLTGHRPPPCSPEEDFARTIGIIFPNVPATIPTLPIAKALNVSEDHVLNLCRARLMRTANGQKWRRGKGGSARILTASVIEFLKRRRII
jgi:hypothetical protein